MTEQHVMPAVSDTNEVQGRQDAQETIAEYRYPGSPPFADTDIDRELFRGRRNEIDHVLHSILSVDLFVVYAISGVGKTSLLTAGVLEPLRQRQYFPVVVRLNDPTITPAALIDAQIRDAGDKAEGITVSRHPSTRDVEPSTLWDLLSGLEIWRGNTLQHLILVFDQFEELFTLDWSDEQRDQFIEQLGQVLRRHRSEDPEQGDGSPLPPPDVKIVLIVREDSLGELEALAAHVPQIMRHRFRLDGLSPESAKAAIREPAAIDDARLITQRFSYTDGAAQAILSFLRAREVHGRPSLTRSIDPSQLQIICQHIERSIVPTKTGEADSDSVVEITEADLGDKEGLERILRDFYRNELAAFSSKERVLVRQLCEVGLINRYGRRLSLEEGQICGEFRLTKPTLEKLVDRRLLRAEPRVGSVYYELAHDTLTAPILAYRDEARSARRQRRRRVFGTVFGLCLAAAVALVVALRNDSSQTGNDASVRGTQTIAVGESVSGEIQGGDRYGVFAVEAPAGQPLVIEVVPDDDRLDAVLEVTDPDGFVQEVDAGSKGDAESVIVYAAEAARHQVTISGSDSSGDFRLSVQRAGVVDLDVGDSVSDAVEAGKPGGVFGFEAPAGQPLIVEVVPDENPVESDESLDVALDLRDPDGLDQYADAGGGGAAEVVVVDGSGAGRFLVVVTGYGSTTGDYQLSIRPADVVDVAVGGAASGAIESGTPSGVFEFEAPAGQPLVVEVGSGKNLDAVLVVRDPVGEDMNVDDGGIGGTESVIVDGSVAGRHLVIVTGFGSTTGEYQLSIRPADVVDVAVGGSVSGAVEAGTRSGVFAFEAPIGPPLIVEVVPDDSLDAVLVVRGPDGVNHYLDDGGSGAAEVVVVDSSVAGRHLVIVSGYGSTTGGYQLSIRPADVVDVAVDGSVSGAIEAGTRSGVFAFEAQTGQPLVVEVVPDDSLDAVLVVRDPDGVDQYYDDGGNGEVEEVVVDDSVAGRHLVVVTGYGSTTGQYELSVRPD
jgi:Novel STAND NTPase 1